MLEPYIQGLERDRDTIADNLTAMGVEATHNETFTSLAPKILDISSGAEPNIFVQTTEPETKDGIWIQSNKTYQRIIVDNYINNENTWDSNIYPTLMASSFSSFRIFPYNNDLYLLNWSYNGELIYLYKFNKDTNTFVKQTVTIDTHGLTPGMATGSGNWGAKGDVIGDYFTAYDNYSSSRCLLKLNMLTFKADINKVSFSSAPWDYCTTEYYNDYAYIFGAQASNGSSAYNVCRKIDYNNATYTNLPSLSYTKSSQSNQWSSIRINNKVYLFNFNNTSGNCKWTIFDLDNETFSDYYDIPSQLNNIGTYNKAILYNDSNLIYMIYDGVWTLNMNTREWTKITSSLPDSATKVKSALSCVFDNNLMLLGGTRTISGTNTSSYNLNKFTLSNKTYTNGDLILNQGILGYPLYDTVLISEPISNLKVPIVNVYLWNDNQLYANLPTYIGNGTSWVQIK